MHSFSWSQTPRCRRTDKEKASEDHVRASASLLEYNRHRHDNKLRHCYQDQSRITQITPRCNHAIVITTRPLGFRAAFFSMMTLWNWGWTPQAVVRSFGPVSGVDQLPPTKPPPTRYHATISSSSSISLILGQSLHWILGTRTHNP